MPKRKASGSGSLVSKRAKTLNDKFEKFMMPYNKTIRSLVKHRKKYDTAYRILFIVVTQQYKDEQIADLLKVKMETQVQSVDLIRPLFNNYNVLYWAIVKGFRETVPELIKWYSQHLNYLRVNVESDDEFHELIQKKNEVVKTFKRGIRRAFVNKNNYNMIKILYENHMNFINVNTSYEDYFLGGLGTLPFETLKPIFDYIFSLRQHLTPPIQNISDFLNHMISSSRGGVSVDIFDHAYQKINSENPIDQESKDFLLNQAIQYGFAEIAKFMMDKGAEFGYYDVPDEDDDLFDYEGQMQNRMSEYKGFLNSLRYDRDFPMVQRLHGMAQQIVDTDDIPIREREYRQRVRESFERSHNQMERQMRGFKRGQQRIKQRIYRPPSREYDDPLGGGMFTRAKRNYETKLVPALQYLWE